MKPTFTLKPVIFGLAAAGLLSATAAEAATKINGDLVEITSAIPKQSVTARPDSFYNLTMGYKAGPITRPGCT